MSRSILSIPEPTRRVIVLRQHVERLLYAREVIVISGDDHRPEAGVAREQPAEHARIIVAIEHRLRRRT